MPILSTSPENKGKPERNSDFGMAFETQDRSISSEISPAPFSNIASKSGTVR